MRMMYYSVMTQANSEKEIPRALWLLTTCINALTLGRKKRSTEQKMLTLRIKKIWFLSDSKQINCRILESFLFSQRETI